MAYSGKQSWNNAPANDTPLSAARLNNMEDGIAAAYYWALGNSLWSAGGSETSPRHQLSMQGGTSGGVHFSYFTAPVATTVSKLGWVVNNATASGMTMVRLGIYTVSGNGDLTLVARTANDLTLGTVADSFNQSALSTVGGYPASYTYIPGQRYAHALLQIGTTPAAILTNFPLIVVPLANIAPRLASIRWGQSDLTNTTAAQLSIIHHQPWIAGIA